MFGYDGAMCGPLLVESIPIATIAKNCWYDSDCGDGFICNDPDPPDLPGLCLEILEDI